MEWLKHKDEGGVFHTLPIEGENYYIKVEKSQGGDYFICVVEYDGACGGDLEYSDTLSKAKKIGESWLIEKKWKEWIAE